MHCELCEPRNRVLREHPVRFGSKRNLPLAVYMVKLIFVNIFLNDSFMSIMILAKLSFIRKLRACVNSYLIPFQSIWVNACEIPSSLNTCLFCLSYCFTLSFAWGQTKARFGVVDNFACHSRSLRKKHRKFRNHATLPRDNAKMSMSHVNVVADHLNA